VISCVAPRFQTPIFPAALTESVEEQVTHAASWRGGLINGSGSGDDIGWESVRGFSAVEVVETLIIII